MLLTGFARYAHAQGAEYSSLDEPFVKQELLVNNYVSLLLV